MADMLRKATSSAAPRVCVRALVVALLGALTLSAAHWPTYRRPIPGQRLHVPGVQQPIYIRDPGLDHAFRPDAEVTVPSYWLAYLGVGSFVASAAVAPPGMRLDCCFLWAVASLVCDLVTTVSKRFCGVLRPNFYGGCGWNSTRAECEIDWLDGRHSFPSGHSSMSSVWATVLAIVCLRAAERSSAPLTASVLRLLAAFGLCGAVFVAMSRVHDNYHSPADVCTGLLLGGATAAVMARSVLPASALDEDATTEALLPQDSAAQTRACSSTDQDGGSQLVL